MFNHTSNKSLSKLNNYFEGWYYKLVSEDTKDIVSFIVGIAKDKANNSHSFIQFIDGISGKTKYIKYNTDEFSIFDNTQSVKIKDNLFSAHGIKLNIKSYDCNIHGEITFDDITDIHRSVISPSAMGFFEYIPFMECKHEVISMSHKLRGNLTINDNYINFADGKGYIEKDSGTSFPKSWVWIHSNNFDNPTVSLMCSVAEIPFGITKFTGFICILTVDGKEYRFATYNNSKILIKAVTNTGAFFKLSNRKYSLEIKSLLNNSGKLIAPTKGQMNRNIIESLTSYCELTLKDNQNNIILRDKSFCCGLEICE